MPAQRFRLPMMALLPAKLIDGPVMGNPQQPGPGIFRHAPDRPFVQGLFQGFLLFYLLACDVLIKFRIRPASAVAKA